MEHGNGGQKQKNTAVHGRGREADDVKRRTRGKAHTPFPPCRSLNGFPYTISSPPEGCSTGRVFKDTV